MELVDTVADLEDYARDLDAPHGIMAVELADKLAALSHRFSD